MAVTWKKLAYEDDVILKTLLDANTVMIAVTDNTPAALAMGASTMVARLAAGNVVAATPTEIRTLLNVADGATANTKATGAEVDAGSDDTKFVTVKAINDSHNVPMVAPSTSGNVLTSNGTDWVSSTPAAGHTQNTDTGTTSTTFQIGSDDATAGPKLANSSGGLEVQFADGNTGYLATGVLRFKSATNILDLNFLGSSGDRSYSLPDVAAGGVILCSNSTLDATKISGTPTLDHISESTAGHGVVCDSVTLKDGGALVITGGTNTFNIANGTASFDVAAAAAVNIDTGLTVKTGAVTLTGNAAGSTLVLPSGSVTLGTMAAETATNYIAKALVTEQGDIIYASAASTPAALAHGAAGNPLITGGHGANPSWLAIVLAGGTNTFSVTNGTASLDIAAGATLNIDVGLQTTGQATVITGAGQANTITLNEGFTIGDGYTGTLTFSAASKTLTVEDTSAVNQDLTSDASPTFNQLNATTVHTTTLLLDHIGEHTGSHGVVFDNNADINGKQLLNAVIHPVADATALAALTPVKGKIAFQNDTAALYVCTSAA